MLKIGLQKLETNLDFISHNQILETPSTTGITTKYQSMETSKYMYYSSVLYVE
jgi:hypothetical protein